MPEPQAAGAFHGDPLGLDLAMDHGWIRTYASDETQSAQFIIASEGGSGTPVPHLSIEADTVNEA